MASTRLRKTFRFSDSDSEDALKPLDEQEQEQLIQSLWAQNDVQNALYKRIFTALPLACLLVYVPLLLSFSTPAAQRYLSVLSVASLLCASYTTNSIRLPGTRNENKRPLRNPDDQRPTLTRYLNTFNASVCITLVVVAHLTGDKTDSAKFNPSMVFWVPGLIFLITRVAEQSIMSVDVEELEDLRYELKGA